MGSFISSSKPSKEDIVSAQKYVDELVDKHNVIVFSKSYCPYCRMAKKSLKNAGVKYEVVELEWRKDCHAIQDYLASVTGGRTVPRVFINGQCIGGGTETQILERSGKLKVMIHSGIEK